MCNDNSHNLSDWGRFWYMSVSELWGPDFGNLVNLMCSCFVVFVFRRGSLTMLRSLANQVSVAPWGSSKWARPMQRSPNMNLQWRDHCAFAVCEDRSRELDVRTSQRKANSASQAQRDGSFPHQHQQKTLNNAKCKGHRGQKDEAAYYYWPSE